MKLNLTQRSRRPQRGRLQIKITSKIKILLIMLALKIAVSGLDEVQKNVAGALTSPEALTVGSGAMANLTRNHLWALEGSRPNQLGGARTNFWSNAAKSILLGTPLKDSMAFTINQVGLAQRWLGGTIKAGAGISSKTGLATKFLAIPARSESYGKTPGEFSDLTFQPRGHDRGSLVQKLYGPEGSSGVSNVVASLVMFWLVPEVTQRADPSVLPTEGELATAAAGAMGSYLSRKLT
jgi:hypothetical protein